jgi:small subunit ribosomal protein S14
MAKKAVINREQKRREIVEKFAAKRALLLATIANVKMGEEERAAARLKLQALPRDSSRCVCVIVVR